MAELLKIEHFEPHVGKLVRFLDTRYAFPLHRIESDQHPLPPGLPRRPFILIFRGPKERDVLPEGQYQCAIEDGPTYPLYVMPIHTPAPDCQEYQAAFN
jgi:hypothetical protein